MNNFTKGILIGVGVGLLIAPFSGEETRRVLGERIAELRNGLPETGQAYVRQVSERVSQTGENLRDYAQQAVTRVKDTGSTLGDLAQRSALEVKLASQDVASTTRQAANSVRSSVSETNFLSDTDSAALN